MAESGSISVASEHPSAIYERLLRPQRIKPTSADQDQDRTRDPDLETISDTGRIVRSAPFRRLQGKAQVFSMARTGAVRTRLTHSIEVSNYGQLIAESVARSLVDSGTLPPLLRFSFVKTVENACLLHDIGNPPFGHMGEYAVQQWFKEANPDLKEWWKYLDQIGDRTADAYCHFDGNPHGFRIITRLQWLRDEFGMNLTCSLLASYLKYLGAEPGDGRFRKKIGYFPTEEDIVKDVWSRLKLHVDREGLPLQRHPLCFLMEAADDIAFCLSDIEDALEKGVIAEKEFIDWMEPKNSVHLRKAVEQAALPKSLARNGTYHLFRLELSRDLVRRASNAYIKHEGSILDGSMDKSLFETDEKATGSLDLMKEFCSTYVYTSQQAVETELAGLNAIKGLLNAYKPLMGLSVREFGTVRTPGNNDSLRRNPIGALLCSLLPQKHVQAYEWALSIRPQLEPVYRTQLVIDYISGMTDSHVLKIFNMINGSQQFGIE